MSAPPPSHPCSWPSAVTCPSSAWVEPTCPLGRRIGFQRLLRRPFHVRRYGHLHSDEQVATAPAPLGHAASADPQNPAVSGALGHPDSDRAVQRGNGKR